MSSLKSLRFAAPAFMKPDGNAVFIVDKIALAANPTAADTIDFKLPAGLYLAQLDFQFDDLDTNGSPTVVFSAGYRPADTGSSLSPSAAYFAATGQTTAQAGGRLRCNFKPIKFEEDVIVSLTVGTASATFAAGEIWMIAAGNCVGVK